MTSVIHYRTTGKPAYLPVALHARPQTLEITWSDAIDPDSAQDTKNYAVKSWSLQRSANYGSKHIDEHELKVTEAELSVDKKTLLLTIPDLRPTWGMEVKLELRGEDGMRFQRTLHETVHSMGDARPAK